MTETKRRVLFVDHTAQLGGAQLTLADLAERFKDSSTVLLLEDGPLVRELKGRGVEVMVSSVDLSPVRRQSGIFEYLSISKQIFRTIPGVNEISSEFDVVFANTPKSAVLSLVGPGLLGGKPVVVYIQDILSNAHFSGSNRALLVHLCNALASAVLTNSEATSTAFIKSGGDASKLRVMYPGVRVPRLLSDEEIALKRKEIGVPPSLPVIGCFSRISGWKGQDTLLRSVKDLPTKVVCLIVGAPLFGENEYFESLKPLAAESGQNVIFTGFRSDAVELMQACDLIVNPSSQPEPFGRTIAEAQLCNRPVIATDAGGGRELISPQANGWLVPPGDVAALAGCIQHILENRIAAESAAAMGQRTAMQRFSLDAMCDTFEATIAGLAPSILAERT